MRILLAGGKGSTYRGMTAEDVEERIRTFYGDRVDVVFVSEEEVDLIRGQEFDVAILDEMVHCYEPRPLAEQPVKIKKGQNKPYFRKGERW